MPFREKEKRYPNERVEFIEIDELYSFIEKNRIYVITLVSRNKRQIVSYDIAFDKSKNRIQNLVDFSPKADRYYSDAYPVYSEILYDGLHTSLKSKSQIYTVESVIANSK